MSSISEAASKFTKPSSSIVAPSNECYSKAALWTDKCIREWYTFWLACEQENMWHDPKCLEPTKRLANQIGVSRQAAEKLKQRSMLSKNAT